MAFFSRNSLILTSKCGPLMNLQPKRFRGKINIQKPRAPHYQRALYFELCKPWFLPQKKHLPMAEQCKGPGVQKKGEEVENPLQKIVAAELRWYFEQSRFVGFYHSNIMTSDQKSEAFIQFKKEQMHLKQYGKKTMELAVKNTIYEPVLELYVSRNMILFSPEPDIKKILKIGKKFPQLILMAGIFEGKFVNRDELTKLSLIPNLKSAQAQLVQTLNGLGQQLVTQLNTHQNGLICNLDERIKQL